METKDLSRSEKLQAKVAAVLGSYFEKVANVNTDLAMSDDRVIEATKELDDTKKLAYYDNPECVEDTKHICAKVFRVWAIEHGCKWDNTKSEWTGKAFRLVYPFVFDDQEMPTKGAIKEGKVCKTARTLVNTRARAASWLAWVDDVYKSKTNTERKARQSAADKAFGYIAEAHKFLPLHVAIKRACRSLKLDETSVRKVYADMFRQARQAHKAQLEAEERKAKNANK